jgi:hypothetical protein
VIQQYADRYRRSKLIATFVRAVEMDWDGQKFLEENIEDGYVLLKPKPHHNKGTEADFVLTGKQSGQDVDNSFRLTSNKN